MTPFLYDRKGQNKLHNIGLNSLAFWAGVVVKVLLGSLLASHFLTGLFIPFIAHFVEGGGLSTYQDFYQQGQGTAFPYPALMLYIMALPEAIFQLFGGENTSPIRLFLYRLPLLAADAVILVILLRWLKRQSSWVIALYWLSPVLMYISYVHGQLDVIPTAFLFCALYFLFKDRFGWATLMLTLAISCKTNNLVALPFYLLYLYSRDRQFFPPIKHGTAVLVGFLLLNAPFLADEGFRQMVFNNREQAKVFDFHYQFSGDLYLYLTPAAFLLLLVKSLTFRAYHRDLFLMFLGFGFGILTLLIPPMQGWYFWLIPFFSYFVIRTEGRSYFLLIALQALYLVYFWISPLSDYQQVWQGLWPDVAFSPTLYETLQSYGINASRAVSVVFTLLQTSLLATCVWVYRRGIQSNTNLKIKYQTYLIGVGGDSGAGKSTFTELLTQVFGERNCAVIRGDDMHRWERGNENWSRLTHLDPKANLLHQDLLHATRLKSGRAIDRRHYDHSDGRFTAEAQIRSNKIVIFEGLHPFYLKQMRQLYDLKVFVEPEKQLRYYWKIQRDTTKRGYSMEKILNQLNQREADSQRYIQSQEKHADLVLQYYNRSPITDYQTQALDLGLRIRIENHIDIELLLEKLSSLDSLTVTHTYGDDDSQVLELYGGLSAEAIADLAWDLLPELEEISTHTPTWQGGYEGLIQLVFTWFIFSKMKAEAQQMSLA